MFLRICQRNSNEAPHFSFHLFSDFCGLFDAKSPFLFRFRFMWFLLLLFQIHSAETEIYKTAIRPYAMRNRNALKYSPKLWHFWFWKSLHTPALSALIISKVLNIVHWIVYTHYTRSPHTSNWLNWNLFARFKLLNEPKVAFILLNEMEWIEEFCVDHIDVCLIKYLQTTNMMKQHQIFWMECVSKSISSLDNGTIGWLSTEYMRALTVSAERIKVEVSQYLLITIVQHVDPCTTIDTGFAQEISFVGIPFLLPQNVIERVCVWELMLSMTIQIELHFWWIHSLVDVVSL